LTGRARTSATPTSSGSTAISSRTTDGYRQILPGHLDAFKRIVRDEHRHLAYRTWYLQRHAADPELAKRVQDKLVQTTACGGGRDPPPVVCDFVTILVGD
jgi:hypothetical protein